MDVVSSQSSCFSFSPFSCFNPLEKKEGVSKTFQERFCVDWRVIPAVAALVSCVLGIVLAIIWKYHYLCIPFGVGTIGATYMLYLAYQSRYWQSLEKTAKQLTVESNKFAGENTRLQTQVNRLEELTNTQSGTISTLNTTVGQVQKERDELQTMLHECRESLDLHLQLTRGLTNLQHLMSSDHTQFSSSVSQFDSQVKEIVQRASANSDHLKAAGDSLQTIFKTITEWLNPQHVQAQMKTQKELNQQLKELSLELGTIKNELGNLQKERERLSGETKKLEETRSRLSKDVGVLGEKIGDLAETAQDLKEIKDDIRAIVPSSPEKANPSNEQEKN